VLLSVLLPTSTSASALQADSVVINELVAANDSYFDAFGDTPDWIELQNNGPADVDLTGWTIADNGGAWAFPPVSIGAGHRLMVFASGRDLSSPQLHTDFSLKRSGETVVLANQSGLIVDSISYPELDDDVAFGRGSAGGFGVLLAATPGAPNSGLAPSNATIVTPPQTFSGTLEVSISGVAQAGESVRYTVDGSPVTEASPAYTGPFSVSTSTVVRAAVVGNGVTGPESSAGYIAISSSLTDFSSDLPLVVVHSTGAVGEDTQDAIVTVIDRGDDGRAGIFDQGDYTGFAGLRIRGASSANFSKKQYKFELWGDRLGDEIDADLLGLGSDSDWVLYAPGRFDRAMINNPFMYELGHRTGVLAPDYQFVELFIEDNPSATVGYGDYRGLYVLRETIKIDDERVDITKHTSTSAGPDGGYIVRYDWNDDCCRNITRTSYGSYVNVDSPKATDITAGQFDYIANWWSDLETAASTSFTAVDEYIEFDSYIDAWLLEILAMDVDVLRASHFMHKDAGGQLRGGPLWDYDRSLGGADSRVNDIAEARAWEPNGSSGHSYDSEIYRDLWDMPEVQARLRSRWAELRSPGGVLSDGELATLIYAMGDEIAEAYTREDAEWGPDVDYGSRFGGLSGEIDHFYNWVSARTEWLDAQFVTDQSPPTVTVPAGGIEFETGVEMSYQVQASDAETIVYAATGLPAGLTIDPTSGLISGTVAYGDSYGEFAAQITVSDSSGAATTVELVLRDPSPPGDGPSMVILNEYNAVSAGKFLELSGSDTYFGTVSGNGGDWFELVIVEDLLDLRGWAFNLWSEDEQGRITRTSSLVLGQDERLAEVRAGTILTIAESVPDDLSYDPANGDWTIHLQSNNAQAGGLLSNQMNFDTNHKNWRLVIRNAAGAVSGYVGGETATFRADGISTVPSTQVLALAEDPAAGSRVYGASTASTFGSPNVLADGSVQDFSGLRPSLYYPGDVSCDGELDLGDALMVAQFSVGARFDSGGCPLVDPTLELNAVTADIDEDDVVTLGDALLLAQCSVGIDHEFCPD
jgi:hypothetical protein